MDKTFERVFLTSKCLQNRRIKNKKINIIEKP